MGRVALVVGGTGMAASSLAPHLLNDFDGDERFDKVGVIALGVTEKTFEGLSERPVTPLATANLNNKDSIVLSLRENKMEDVTHVFWFVDANRPPKMSSAVSVRYLLSVAQKIRGGLKGLLKVSPKGVQNKFYGALAYIAGSGSQPRNLEWLNNIFQALADVGAPLENFCLGTGGKHYGMHLGPFIFPEYETPFDEDVHRGPSPLSYFEMQELVEARALQEGFTWNVVRPSFIIGASLEKTNTTQNFGLVLAVYCSLLKLQGKALFYPGGSASWTAKQQFSTSRKIAQVAAWASTGSVAGITGKAGNQPAEGEGEEKSVRATANTAFNVVSCPSFSWSEIWDDIANFFEMEAGPSPQSTAGENCMDILGGSKVAQETWDKLVEQERLFPHQFSEVFNADFFDKSFSTAWDAEFSTNKLQRFGFPKEYLVEYSSGMEVLREFFAELQDKKVIP